VATPEDIASVALQGEELGFAFVSFSDHIVLPRQIESDYPYNDDGRYVGGRLFGAKEAEYLDQLTTMAFVAARTRYIRLLTSVMVVPYRAPIYTAKALATIDVLSGGRLTLGFGAGWMREEFEALSAPPFDRRGAVTNEYIRAFKELWTADNPCFKGEFVEFKDISFEPKPVQRPHPPIWVGGESDPALRRVARLADGWFPFAHSRPPAIGSLDAMRAGIERLGRLAEEAGREPGSIEVILDTEMLFSDGPEVKTSTGERQIFTGSPDAIASDLRAFAIAGVGQFQVIFPGDTAAEMIEHMQSFKARIAPLVQDL
jgi:probable F420-dependent oxidoreductase